MEWKRKMIKIGELRFNNIPTKIELVKARRAKYFHESEDERLPKKYRNYYYDYLEVETSKDKYERILCDLSNNEPVVANPNVAGQPVFVNIGGNKLHELAYTDSKKASSIVIKIKKVLKEYFLQHLDKSKIKITKFPINVEFKFYVNEENPLDRDNLGIFYEKIFFDCIQTEIFLEPGKKGFNPKGFIKNDDIKHVNSSRTAAFFTKREPYLIINFYEYEDTDEYNRDKSNSSLSKRHSDSVLELSELFAKMNVNRKYRQFEQFDKTTGEFTEDVMKYYISELEFYTKKLSNAFLE